MILAGPKQTVTDQIATLAGLNKPVVGAGLSVADLIKAVGGPKENVVGGQNFPADLENRPENIGGATSSISCGRNEARGP